MKLHIWEKDKDLAQSELRLESYLSNPIAGEEHFLTQNAIRLLQGKVDRILSEPDNEEVLKVLPVAKKYIRQRKAREEALEKHTIIGPLKALLDYWGALMYDGVDEAPDETFAKSCGLGNDDLEIWEKITSAIVTGDRPKIVESVRDMVGSLCADLIYTPLPQVPELPPDLEVE